MEIHLPKKHIEKYSLALATVMKDGKPNLIGVAYTKVVGDDLILITDNFMNQTIKDIKSNPNVVLVCWNEDMEGFKFIGTAEYFKSGKWLNFVKSMPENNNLPAKGAVLVTVSKIISSK